MNGGVVASQKDRHSHRVEQYHSRSLNHRQTTTQNADALPHPRDLNFASATKLNFRYLLSLRPEPCARSNTFRTRNYTNMWNSAGTRQQRSFHLSKERPSVHGDPHIYLRVFNVMVATSDAGRLMGNVLTVSCGSAGTLRPVVLSMQQTLQVGV
jgi:hypothetical protein